MNLHPKIKAASIASALTMILTIAGTLLGAVPNSPWSTALLGVLNAVSPLAAGYAKTAP